MNRATHIYALHDPTDRSARVYVGKTIDPAGRFRDHCKPSTDKGIRAEWIKALLARGVRPEMVTLEVVPPGEDWQEAERFWIESFRAMGASTANHTLGGEGALGYRHSPEVRARLSAALRGNGKGIPKSPEHVARLRAAGKGRTPAPGTLAAVRRIADERRGKPLVWTRGPRSESARAAMSKGRAGTKVRGASGFKGVARSTSCDRYEARIWLEGKQRILGLFRTAEAAALAYDEAARQKWGNEAALNFPGPGERGARA